MLVYQGDVRDGHSGVTGTACIDHLENIRAIVRGRAELAGLDDPAGFSYAWNILMKGCIVGAAEGDIDAAQRAKRFGAWLLDERRVGPEQVRIDVYPPDPGGTQPPCKP